MPKVQVGAMEDSEPRMLLKTTALLGLSAESRVPLNGQFV
jgi:hypothetical protein